MSVRWENVCVAAEDPAAAGGFWAAVLGWRTTFADDDEVVLEPPVGSPLAGHVPDLIFLRTPGVKAAQNRLHIDLRPDDQAVEVVRLEALGARRADIGQGDVPWVVMADPWGNEFCVLSPNTGDTA
jgi:catechol 2,3-dioxygenase-like lactoylglutathione lyase family enzyme